MKLGNDTAFPPAKYDLTVTSISLGQYYLRWRYDGAELAPRGRDPSLPHHGRFALVKRRTFHLHQRIGGRGGENRFSIRSSRCASLRQIGEGGERAQRIGQRHDCAIVQDAGDSIKFGTHFGQFHSDQAGKLRLQLGLPG